MHLVFLGERRFGNQYSLFLFKVLRGDLREIFPLRAIVMAIVIAELTPHQHVLGSLGFMTR